MKSRIIHLLEILKSETDEENGLTMPQIIDLLSEEGISAERRVIYKDFEKLREFGYQVSMTYENPVRYRLVDREFSQDDLLLMVDAVQSSKFITKRKSDALVRSIKKLGSRYQTKTIGKSPRVSGRIKNQNKSSFLDVNTIQEAIGLRRKVKFQYFNYGWDKKPRLRRNGDYYLQTPVQLFYQEGNYYLVAFDDEGEKLKTYRVDRMTNVSVSDEKSTRSKVISTFDAEQYEARAFGMFSGDVKTITIEADENLIGNVIDKFGTDFTSRKGEEGKVLFSVRVFESDVLFGWVSQFRGRMKVVSPNSSVENYRLFIRDLFDANGVEEVSKSI